MNIRAKACFVVIVACWAQMNLNVEARGDSPEEKPAAAEVIIRQLGLAARVGEEPVLENESVSLLPFLDPGGRVCGVLVGGKADSGPQLREALFENGVPASFEKAREAARRAVGGNMTLGVETFSYDGPLSYRLIFPFASKATGRQEGSVAIDVLTGRLALAGPAGGAHVDAPSNPPAESRVLNVERLTVHLTNRATALAMLFMYLSQQGHPEVGPPEGGRTEADIKKYIEEFSRACGACSERTATERFVTGRKTMADIGTYRVSADRKIDGLADRLIAEIDAGRPAYARLSTGNVNQFIVVCGYVRVDDETFLVARLPATDEESGMADGYAALRLPAAFDSAEIVTVALKDKS